MSIMLYFSSLLRVIRCSLGMFRLLLGSITTTREVLSMELLRASINIDLPVSSNPTVRMLRLALIAVSK